TMPSEIIAGSLTSARALDAAKMAALNKSRMFCNGRLIIFLANKNLDTRAECAPASGNEPSLQRPLPYGFGAFDAPMPEKGISSFSGDFFEGEMMPRNRRV